MRFSSFSSLPAQFWQYLYSPTSSPVQGEVPVVFVPVDLEDFRIVAVGRQLTLGVSILFWFHVVSRLLTIKMIHVR